MRSLSLRVDLRSSLSLPLSRLSMLRAGCKSGRELARRIPVSVLSISTTVLPLSREFAGPPCGKLWYFLSSREKALCEPGRLTESRPRTRAGLFASTSCTIWLTSNGCSVPVQPELHGQGSPGFLPQVMIKVCSVCTYCGSLCREPEVAQPSLDQNRAAAFSVIVYMHTILRAVSHASVVTSQCTLHTLHIPTAASKFRSSKL